MLTAPKLLSSSSHIESPWPLLNPPSIKASQIWWDPNVKYSLLFLFPFWGSFLLLGFFFGVLKEQLLKFHFLPTKIQFFNSEEGILTLVGRGSLDPKESSPYWIKDIYQMSAFCSIEYSPCTLKSVTTHNGNHNVCYRWMTVKMIESHKLMLCH